MKKFLIKIGINAIGLYVASIVVGDGISFQGHGMHLFWTVVIVAVIFGLVNTIIRPIVKLLSFGLIIVTLGLITFVINALMLWLTSKISEHFSEQFYVKDFWAALLGSLIITAISMVAHALLPDDDK